MRQHTKHLKGLRRFGVAVAVGALAMVGLIPATASGASPGAAAALGPSNCGWVLTPSPLWVTDPEARGSLILGNYSRPGSTGVAYKVTGQFSHSTTLVFTAYNNLLDIVSPAYTINDSNIIPDPGSVNPFVPGTRVMAPNRSYTVWFWPDSIPVPAG